MGPVAHGTGRPFPTVPDSRPGKNASWRGCGDCRDLGPFSCPVRPSPLRMEGTPMKASTHRGLALPASARPWPFPGTHKASNPQSGLSGCPASLPARKTRIAAYPADRAGSGGTRPETFSFLRRQKSTRQARGEQRCTTPGDAEGGPGANSKAVGGSISGRVAEAHPEPPRPHAVGVPLLAQGGAPLRARPGGGSRPSGDEAEVRGRRDPTASPQDPQPAPTSGLEGGFRKGSTTAIQARRSPSPQEQEDEAPTTGASSDSSSDAGGPELPPARLSGGWETPGPGLETPFEGPKLPQPCLEPPNRSTKAQKSKTQIPGLSLRPGLTRETRLGGLAKARSPSPSAGPRPTNSDPSVGPARDALTRGFPTPPGPGGTMATEPGDLHPLAPSCPGRVGPPPQENPAPRTPPSHDVRPSDPERPGVDSLGASSARVLDRNAGPGPLPTYFGRPMLPSPGSPCGHEPGPQVSPRRPMGQQGRGKCPPPLRTGPDKREKDTDNAVARTEASDGRTPHREGAARPTRGLHPGPVSPGLEPPPRSRGTGWAQRPLRPALGTHAAKARGQGRATRPDDPTDPAGPGRSRTQIITSAADRGDVLPGPGRDPGTPKLPMEGPDLSPPDWATPGSPRCPPGRPSRETGPHLATDPEAPRSPLAGRGEVGEHFSPSHQGPEVPPEAGLAPSMEERVMRGIQEKLDPPPQSRAGPRAAPSIAGWFGFRRSRLPGLGGRRPRPVRHEEDKPGLAGRRPKPEQNGVRKGLEPGDEEVGARDPGRGVFGAAKWLVTTPTPHGSRTGLPGRPPSTTKDAFLKELLIRVDKKSGQRTESGSGDVSFGGSSGPGSRPFPRPSRGLGPSGSRGENGKEKSGMEMRMEVQMRTANANRPEDVEEDASPDPVSHSGLLEPGTHRETGSGSGSVEGAFSGHGDTELRQGHSSGGFWEPVDKDGVARGH
ncbi:collagen alpha-1(I) chain-like [Tachyglossus aculeatus]|uniref:collagen alpha-1(I) chain-like n=1 Tax=Tachyglossus aculeatus TaxID=9261 RepID=UPI0018F52CD1|nr:collagen alpha-1(I) chain-like [Tachyglossus aculeatus]